MRSSRSAHLRCTLNCLRRPFVLNHILGGSFAVSKEQVLRLRKRSTQGPVVQKPVNANLGLKVNRGFCFSC